MGISNGKKEKMDGLVWVSVCRHHHHFDGPLFPNIEAIH